MKESKKYKFGSMFNQSICRIMLIMVIITQTFSVFGQTSSQVSGEVHDSDGFPLIGVSVKQQGTANGTITDIDGKFSFVADPKSSLEISYVGYKTAIVAIDGRTSLGVIVLAEDTQLLDEVVVVGYGTMEKRQVSSSISSIRAKDLPAGVGGATIGTALRGKIPGLNISGSSSPNSSSTIQLRGITSINAGKGPLVVIDGVPGGDIRSVNQEDIESIDVLKDASAGAIYGTRAAGGVILITTKGGKLNSELKLTYTGELSFETVKKRPEVLSKHEFLNTEFTNSKGELIKGLGNDYGADIDWYDAVLRESPISHRHVVNLAGGSQNIGINATFSMSDQQGISIGDGRKDYSGRINTNFLLFDGFLDIRSHVSYREANRTQTSSPGMYRMAIRANPTIPIYNNSNPTGFNTVDDWATGEFNPVADANLRERGGKDTWLMADITAKMNFTKDLYLETTLGYETREWRTSRYVSRYHNESIRESRRGEAYHGSDRRANKSLDTYLNYSKTLGKHTFSGLLGYSFYESNRDYFNMKNFDFPVEAIGPWDIGKGTHLGDGRAEMSSWKYPRERLSSYFGRGNYSFDGRYVATVSFRHEGSSKFGANHKWGTFWAVSGGWNASEESFIKDISWIDELKVRLGYGVTGNNDFDSGIAEVTYASDTWYPNINGWDYTYGPANNRNPDLKWEEKSEINFGFDYAFFRNRLYGKFDVYKRKVSDMLYKANVSQPPFIYETTMKNVGDLENFGWEFEIGGIPVQTKEFEWNTIVRLSQYESTIKNLGGNYLDVTDGGFPSPGNPGNPFRLRDGMKIGQFYMLEHAGIDENGKFLVYGADGEVKLGSKATNADKRYVGNAMPKMYLSWDNNFQYKNWDLSINTRANLNFDVFNQVDMYYGLPPKAAGENVLKKAFSEERKSITDEKQLSSYWLERTSFFKIDAIILGYTLNLKQYNKYFNSARLYFSGRDLLTISGYSGVNPEVETTGLKPGLDTIEDKGVGMYPSSRRFTFGIQLNF